MYTKLSKLPWQDKPHQVTVLYRADAISTKHLQDIQAMPSLTLVTSLPASSLVDNAMPRWCVVMTVDMSHSCCRLVRFLAPLLSKQEQQINWVLDTEKRMAKVGIMIMAVMRVCPCPGWSRQLPGSLCVAPCGVCRQLQGSRDSKDPNTATLPVPGGGIGI